MNTKTPRRIVPAVFPILGSNIKERVTGLWIQNVAKVSNCFDLRSSLNRKKQSRIVLLYMRVLG